MLQINDLTFRIDGRALFEGASAQIADGWKVGLVGRNGTGKSTLLRIIREELNKGEAGDGSVRINRGAKMGYVLQEVPANDLTLLDVVLEADAERASLMREADTCEDPDRIGEIHERLADIDAWSGEARAAEILVGLGFTQNDLSRACKEFSGGWRMRAALGGVLFAQPDLLMLDEPTNYLDLEAPPGSKPICANTRTPSSSSATIVTCSTALSPTSSRSRTPSSSCRPAATTPICNAAPNARSTSPRRRKSRTSSAPTCNPSSTASRPRPPRPRKRRAA